MTRTSLTHPLLIDTVALPGGACLGLTFCPGKKQPNAMTGAWDRDLDLDLQAVKAWGAQGVLTLLEPEELQLLGVPQLGEEVKSHGMAWHHIHLPNDAVPDARFMEQWQAGRAALHEQLDKGGKIMIHCMGGIGRTAMVAAMLMIERGVPAKTAMEQITAARGDAFCVPEQVAFIMNYKPAPVRSPSAKKPPSPAVRKTMTP